MIKVSIVIPAYNAAKTIGKCLNSILGQTLRDFEVIIVNDGSTDKTLNICKRYCDLDKRFKVFTIKNGGVSKARNYGITKTKGEYLTFVDSDDIISPYFLEKMVVAAEKYKTGLVISDFVMIDFDRPEDRFVLSGKGYAKGEPAVVSKTEFDSKIMEIIWKTSLMESACGKLVNLAIWKKNKIKIDEELSLGEDFLANLEYYKYANGVVFLNEPLYCYNNVDNSGSLSHKYRADLFEIKMYLAKKLEDYLGDIQELPKKQQEYFYNYVAAYGMVGLENVIGSHKYQRQKERLGTIKKIVDDDFFVQALKKATYLKYPKWKKLILNKSVKKLSSEKIQGQDNIKGGNWKNRLARRLMKFYYCEIRKDLKRGEMIDRKLAMTGIRNTFKSEFGKKSTG